MSIKRMNWSALSSLARQRTVEDEEEVQRERRRRGKSSSSTADPDAEISTTGRDTSSADDASGTSNTREESQSLNREDQMQQDFMEILRVRDEKRRLRHAESLKRQKEVGSDRNPQRGGRRDETEAEQCMVQEQDGVFETQPALKTTSSNSRKSDMDKHQENGELRQDSHPKPSSNPGRKFVSSVSISLDRTPSVSESTTPLSPCSPQEDWPSPCQSPSPPGARSPAHVYNRHEGQDGTLQTNTNGVSAKGSFEPTSKPTLGRHSSRTVSFRLMKKREEESAPLQRSCSVKMASKKFEPKTEQNEDKGLPFQRNSRQRASARSIQEKMEKLAQAALRAEMCRSPDSAHRTLLLQDEVSRKRGLFEKEQSSHSPPSPGVTVQEQRGFTSGVTERINRWRSKSHSSHSPTDLRHVDINSKRSLFENREDNVSKTSSGNFYK